LLAVAVAATLAAGLAITKGAPARDLHSKLHHKQAQLQHAKSRTGVLSTTIQRYGNRLDQLRTQVASLRKRQASVQDQLAKTRAELERDRAKLELLRARLRRALTVLRRRLVAIYESSQPDVVSVILNSRGFEDLLSRYDYLRRIQSQDASIAGRVRSLRNQTRGAVDRVRAERNQIAAKQAELARTQNQLQAQQGSLVAARQRNQQVLSRVQATQNQLEGDVSHIQGQIQAQLQAAEQAQRAQQASGVTTTTPAPSAAPQAQSSSGFIWPVNGPVVSPFGPRTINGHYEFHPGIDIAVPTGTPIHAAAAGTVALAGPNDGYGNYTCIDHGGGLSTCYAHQETIMVSVGEHISQGQVIGLSDCTGYCFGPHLHFEVRVNGQVVDPMGYLP
jgi:murein DD-endopeptidase MepM/ murein hydrolase activator NlpD